MLFRDARIRNKKIVLKETREFIVDKLKRSLFNFNDLSIIAVNKYVEILILESEYDLEKDCFVYPFGTEEISRDDLASIAYEYVTENMPLFLKSY